MATDPTQMTALELAGYYERRKLSPVEVTQAIIDRIDDVDGQINAYAIVDAEGAMEAAKKAEKRWKKGKPLSRRDGVPVSIKELIHTKGMPTVMGSQLIPPDSQPWDYDAPSVARAKISSRSSVKSEVHRRSAP